MFTTTKGFETFKVEDGFTYDGYFFTTDFDEWPLVISVLPAINAVVERRNLLQDVRISYGPGMLTVGFMCVPKITEAHIEAGKEILAILKPTYLKEDIDSEL